MGSRPAVALLAVGTKGLALASDLADAEHLAIVVTYGPRGTSEPGPEEYGHRFGPTDTAVVVDRRPDLDALATQHGVGLVLTVGWQYLIDPVPAVPLVVLHDSPLPELRGFAPTVTALIEGRDRLGVTAILPAAEADAGDVLAQHCVAIVPPVRLATALELLRPCYLSCATDVIDLAAEGPLVGTPQDDALATHSIWRDTEDYRLDLAADASRVVRTVLALGDPYPGATALLDGEEVRVLDAHEEAEVAFVHRAPGKVWRADDRGPVVVCGRGMVRFTDLRDRDGRPVRLAGLRHRFT